MTTTIRRTGQREELDHLWGRLVSLLLLVSFSTFDDAAIGNGLTAGRLRTNAAVDFRIVQTQYNKASTDDLWDLSGETATGAAEYRAYWLLLDSAGAASFAAGSDEASEADALRALPQLDGTKSVIGAYVAGPSTNFAAALAAQGTIYDGLPAGANVGVHTKTLGLDTIQTVYA